MTSKKLWSSLALGILAACWLGLSGCVAHVDHDFHHDGYYDGNHEWHGGYYDADRNYHEDPHDWHK